MAFRTFLRLRPRLAGFGFALALLASSSCGGGSGEATGSTCPTGSTLTYASFGQPFFQAHCLACHGGNGSESPKYDTAAEIRAHASEIDKDAAAGPNAVNTVMPESGSVDEAERRKLG